MDQSGIIQCPDRFRCTFEITAEGRFISHGPHNNGWMIAVSLHHADAAVHIHGFPCRIICDPGIIFYPLESMTFQICFIDHIQAICITQIIKVFICRIMGTTDRIDIILFHQTDIRFHLFPCDSSSFRRIIIMMIHSVQQNNLAIDAEIVVFDLNSAKTAPHRHFLSRGTDGKFI